MKRYRQQLELLELHLSSAWNQFNIKIPINLYLIRFIINSI